MANSATTPPNLRAATSMGLPRSPRSTNNPLRVPTSSSASAPPEMAGRMWMRSRSDTLASELARSPLRNTFTWARIRPRSSSTHPASFGNSVSSLPMTSPMVPPSTRTVPEPPARSRSGERKVTSTMPPLLARLPAPANAGGLDPGRLGQLVQGLLQARRHEIDVGGGVPVAGEPETHGAGQAGHRDGQGHVLGQRQHGIGRHQPGSGNVHGHLWARHVRHDQVEPVAA